MKRHVKASSVGPSSRQGQSLGSLRRGALAVHGAFGDADGSSASFNRGRARLFALCCLAIGLTTLLTASPTFAEETHPFTGLSFGPDGTSASSFSSVGGVAIDPANNNVYAYDAGAGKVYKFDSAGNPVNFSALSGNVIEGVGGSGYGENEIAVAPPGSPGGTAGDIYVAHYPVVLVYGSDGTQLGELTNEEACGVATDPAGHVFVGFYPQLVREYTPSTSPVTNADQTGRSSAELIEICNVAADGLGNVYAATYAGSFHGVVKLEGLDAENPTPIDPEPVLDPEPPRGHTLAVDPVTNDVYVYRDSSIAQYDSTGTQLDVFGSGRLSESSGLAVNGASGGIYVGNSKSQRIDVFGPVGNVPDVTAQAATAITPTKATLNGIVNPDGIAVSNCEFEYGTTTAYGNTASCIGAIPTDSSDHPVSAVLSSLSSETTYHFRLAASNANGFNESADQTFTTSNPAFTTNATAVSGAKATLNGVVFPEGEAVSECFFEYGVEFPFDKAPCEGAIPTDEGEHVVTAALSHLAPNGITYTFRVVIKRGSETIEGPYRTFQTADTVITGSANAIDPPTASIEGTVNPEGIPYTECIFEYGPAFGDYDSSVLCAESPAAIGEGTSPVSVHGNLNGLSFEATYHYRLVATNADGTTRGEDRSFNTPGAPRIENEQATGVTDTKAELVATINPKGLATTYHLEYGTDVSYGQSTTETQVGTGEVGQTLTNAVEGLTPDTVYHWRAVASNEHGVSKGLDHRFTTYAAFGPEASCPNQALRSGASSGLSDCRAYEMVSPARKVGEVFPPSTGYGTCSECLPGINGGRMPMQSTPDGKGIVFQGQPFSAGLASGPNEYLANRDPAGWETKSLSSPLFEDGGRSFQGFSPDLSRGVIYQSTPALSPQAPAREGKSYPNLYLRDANGSLRPLVAEEPPHRDPGYPEAENGFQIVYAGANSGTSQFPAFSHLVFEADDTLTAATAIAPAAVDGGHGGNRYYPVNMNIYEWVEGQLRLVNVMPGNTTTTPGAVIGSGSLLLPNMQDSAYEAPVVDHAISADGSRIFWSDEATGQAYVRIDGKETQEIKDNGKFLTASVDGSKVLLSNGCLYDLTLEECQDLTAGQGEFKGILGAAEDLSRVYFVDTAALTGSEENENNEHAEAGEFNLYTWHQGATAFVGSLLGDDNSLGVGNVVVGSGDWRHSPRERTAQVSPDGRYLAFMSRASLTGYDNTQANGASSCFGSCPEVFEYDAASESLNCASCNPANQRPLGKSNLSAIEIKSGSHAPFSAPNNLTTDGDGRLFFESEDVLSPRDDNGHIQDVYEWKPNGVGSCSRVAGCVSLISSGHSANDSHFVDASPGGKDVFFITREQLLLRDKDELLDLYDARVNGGFNEKNTPPPCLGEACKGPATVAPEQQSAGSSTFAGPGNEKPKKAKKHKKKKRKHAHKHKSQKRSAKHNSGGSK